MSKSRGGYAGGSTVLRSSGAGFSDHPDFWHVSKKKKKRARKTSVDRAYVQPPLTKDEQAETEEILRKMLGPNYDLVMAQRERNARR